mgnify:CR=1 FL=1
MNKKKYLFFALLVVIFFSNSCQTAKDALQGKKRSEQGDEFLVEKKKPLTIPPDFDSLPEPGGLEIDTNNEISNADDIKKLLNVDSESQNKNLSESTDLETSVLSKIKNK